MTVIRNNSISGINSITAQSSSLNFYDSSGNTLSIGASVSGNITGDVTGNLTGNVTVATGATISGSTNTITASTNGSERVRIDSSGNIGIGTDNPSTNIHIYDSSQPTIRLDRIGSPRNNFVAAWNADELVLAADHDNSGGASRIRFFVDSNEKVRIDDNGNIVMVNSGTGIDFSATSDASGRTSELLDDYEEGTWTPVLEGSTTNPTYSGTQSGDYTKVGNMVTCWGYIDTNPVTGAGSGNISISGLPFASGLPSASTYNGSVAVWGPTFSGTLSSRINNASTSIIFYQIASNTGISQWTFATASWSSGDAIYFQVSYTVG